MSTESNRAERMLLENAYNASQPDPEKRKRMAEAIWRYSVARAMRSPHADGPPEPVEPTRRVRRVE